MNLTSSDDLVRPEWLIVTPEQIAKARRIITRDFWKTDSPFTQPEYREINLPLNIGTVTAQNTEAIYRSQEYRDADRDYNGRYRRNFYAIFSGEKTLDEKQIPLIHQTTTVPDFLSPIFRQYMQGDHYIYRQNNVLWEFTVDIAKLRRDMRHRSTSGYKIDYHIDGPLGGLGEGPNPMTSKRYAEAFRDAQKTFYTFNRKDVPMPTMEIGGTQRIYATANVYQTDFKDRGSFDAWNIAHFIVEPHGSPTVPENCTRVFVRGTATPL